MTSIFQPETAAGAFDAFLPGALAAENERRDWTPEDGALPVLYLSHGAPPLLDDGGWMKELFAWAHRLPQPRAVLIVSAHWEHAPLMISASGANTDVVYDFGGFDPRYYTLRYDTPDASGLVRQIKAVLPDGESLHEHASRGLDHGAWVPLKVMYPNGRLPVLQMSIPTHDPARLMTLGERLRPLREQGVLVIGSGFMTHGLPFLTRDMIMGGTVPTWSQDFHAWATEALGRGDVDALAGYRAQAPGMPYAHPTVEHFVPIFVTLGASTDAEAPVDPLIDGYWMGLARTSFQAG